MNIRPLEVSDLVVRFGDREVLDVPALEVGPGEVLAVIGPNGAGKTVLLTTLALLSAPTAGSIRIYGQEISRASDLVSLRRRMAVVFQDPLLLNSSVEDNVELGLRLRGVSRAESKLRAQDWLDRFAIGRLAKRNARTLSGGEAQRVSLARAFVLAPEILFLDEPFSALDMPTHNAIIDDLRMVLKETGTTTIFVTHSRDEALALAHRVAVLMGGKVLQTGTPNEVFASPVNEEVANFVGMENILPGEVAGRRDGLAQVRVGSAIIEAVSGIPAGQRVSLCVRPEEVTLLVPGRETGRTSARNHFTGSITGIGSFGGLVRVTLDCGFPLVVTVTRLSAEEMGLREKSSVEASFKASAVHLIPRS